MSTDGRNGKGESKLLKGNYGEKQHFSIYHPVKHTRANFGESLMGVKEKKCLMALISEREKNIEDHLDL